MKKCLTFPCRSFCLLYCTNTVKAKQTVNLIKERCGYIRVYSFGVFVKKEVKMLNFFLYVLLSIILYCSNTGKAKLTVNLTKERCMKIS
jgi:hypothetical protein